MSATTESHHHRNTTKVGHKPFKPRFTSKNALKDRSKGRVEQIQGKPRKTPHQQVMSKFDRKNQAKQKRLASHQDHIRDTSVFTGKDGAPRIVAVVPLCDGVSAVEATQSLNSSLDIEGDGFAEGVSLVNIDRFRQKIEYVAIKKDLLAAMDACRVADYVLFILSATEEVDEAGESIIRCVEGQGISHVYTAVQGLDKIEPPKKRPQVTASLKSFITHFFPEQEKVFSLDARQECQNMIRSLCTTVPKGIRWREDRSWMLVEDVQWAESSMDAATNGSQESKTTGILTGFVRGKSLKADRLVQIGDWGDFQIEKIVAAPLAQPTKPKEQKMAVDVNMAESVLDNPSDDRDTLEELAPEEAVMEDANGITPSLAPTERKSVLLDDYQELSESEDDDDGPTVKRLPKGTSDYQAAWFLGDISDSGSDMEDVEDDLKLDVGMEDAVTPADGIEGASRSVPAEPTEAAMSEYPESEAFGDPGPEEQTEAEELASFRAAKKAEAEEDRQFPDEVELHPNVSARERLARYRGLKSLRTSPWDTEEDIPYQPTDWDRLLEIRDYKGAKNKVLRETLIGGVKPGTRVQIYVRNLPLSAQQTYDKSKPLPLFSLLRHEHKRTAVDVSISLDTSNEEPLKSKEELIMQCGPRRFIINPLFSQGGNTPNNVHKFERYLHPGRTAVASITAPLTWGSVPTLFFKRSNASAEKSKTASESAQMDIDDDTAEDIQDRTSQPLILIAHGTTIPASSVAATSSSSGPSSAPRIIAKRITLTGQPYKIHKKLVTIRYMFFNPQDVAYFRSLPLWTNRGRQGMIKESLGTHGYFKATFDSRVGMMDAVGVSLYKRVWPRPAQYYRPGAEVRA